MVIFEKYVSQNVIKIRAKAHQIAPFSKIFSKDHAHEQP